MMTKLSDTQLAGMSLLDPSKWLVDSPEWTCEAALSLLEEVRGQRLLLKDLDPATFQAPAASLCWQQQGPNLWVFGELVRGVVRKEAARVWTEFSRWYWRPTGADPQPCASLGSGVEAAEIILGVV